MSKSKSNGATAKNRFPSSTREPMIQMKNGCVWPMSESGWIHGCVMTPFDAHAPQDLDAMLDGISEAATGSPVALTDISYHLNGSWCYFGGFFHPDEVVSDSDFNEREALRRILRGKDCNYPRLVGERLFKALLKQYPMLTEEMARTAVILLDLIKPLSKDDAAGVLYIPDTPLSIMILARSRDDEVVPYMNQFESPHDMAIALFRAIRRSSKAASRIMDAGLYVGGIQVSR